MWPPGRGHAVAGGGESGNLSLGLGAEAQVRVLQGAGEVGIM